MGRPNGVNAGDGYALANECGVKVSEDATARVEGSNVPNRSGGIADAPVRTIRAGDTIVSNTGGTTVANMVNNETLLNETEMPAHDIKLQCKRFVL